MGIVAEYFAHYASEYYDPAKAREYYLRTRELKGRTAGNLKTENKKIGWQYAKNQIDAQKKTTLDTANAENNAAIEATRTAATAKRKEIAGQIKAFMQRLSEQATAERENLSTVQQAELERISSKAEADIAALPEIPKGVSKEKRAELTAERSQKIAEIRGEATLERSNVRDAISTNRKALSTEVSSVKDTARETATAERERISGELKSAVETTKANYEKRKEEIKAKYETAYQTEYDAIKNNV